MAAPSKPKALNAVRIAKVRRLPWQQRMPMICGTGAANGSKSERKILTGLMLGLEKTKFQMKVFQILLIHLMSGFRKDLE